jgi:hypothetical protein
MMAAIQTEQPQGIRYALGNASDGVTIYGQPNPLSRRVRQ